MKIKRIEGTMPSTFDARLDQLATDAYKRFRFITAPGLQNLVENRLCMLAENTDTPINSILNALGNAAPSFRVRRNGRLYAEIFVYMRKDYEYLLTLINANSYCTPTDLNVPYTHTCGCLKLQLIFYAQLPADERKLMYDMGSVKTTVLSGSTYQTVSCTSSQE